MAGLRLLSLFLEVGFPHLTNRDIVQENLNYSCIIMTSFFSFPFRKRSSCS